MGYCKDCKNGEIARYGIYCSIYHRTFKEYDGCDRYFSSKQSSSSSGCFLTTACVDIMGRPDDCFELNTLRYFRDNFILKEPGGELDVNEYYEMAPRLVSELSKRDDSIEIYRRIYTDLILKALNLIAAKRFHDAHALYKEYVLDLKREYL